MNTSCSHGQNIREGWLISGIIQNDKGYLFSRTVKQNNRIQSQTFFNRNGDTLYACRYTSSGHISYQKTTDFSLWFAYPNNTHDVYQHCNLQIANLPVQNYYCKKGSPPSGLHRNDSTTCIWHYSDDIASPDTACFFYTPKGNPLGFNYIGTQAVSGMSISYDTNNEITGIQYNGSWLIPKLKNEYDVKNKLIRSVFAQSNSGTSITYTTK